MACYHVTLTPLEPYFLGQERGFRDAQKNDCVQRTGTYHVESDVIPSQSTLLGMLRFLLINDLKKDDFNYSKSEWSAISSRIGEKSFSLDSVEETPWIFGIIDDISPVFLVDEKGDWLIPTPLNHRNTKEEEQEYTPFILSEEVQTNSKGRYLPIDYQAKDGLLMDSFMDKNGKIITNLFSEMTRTGIKTGADQEGFFKKSYCQLAQGYAFRFFAELSENNIPEFLQTDCYSTIVFLGKGKSAFKATISKDKNGYKQLTDAVAVLLKQKNQDSLPWAYALSDCLVDASALYENCSFASTQTRELRTMSTNRESSSGHRYQKTKKLYTLIKAGSFFRLRDSKKLSDFEKIGSIRKIGWNTLIYGGIENEN